MRVRHLLATAACALILAGFALGQQDEVKAILDKAIEAHGGEATLKKHQASRVKTKGRLEMAGGIDFTQEIAVQLPNKLRDEMDLDVNGQKIHTRTIFNGEK